MVGRLVGWKEAYWSTGQLVNWKANLDVTILSDVYEDS